MLRHLLGVAPVPENLQEAKNWLRTKHGEGIRRVGIEVNIDPLGFFQALYNYAGSDLKMDVVPLGYTSLSRKEVALGVASVLARNPRFANESEAEIRSHFGKTKSTDPASIETYDELVSLLVKAANEAKNVKNPAAKHAALSLYHAFVMKVHANQTDVEAAILTPLKAHHFKKIFGRQVSCDFNCPAEDLQSAVHIHELGIEHIPKYDSEFLSLLKELHSKEEVKELPKKEEVKLGFFQRLKRFFFF